MEKSKNWDLIYPAICACFCVIGVVSNVISAKMVKWDFFAGLSIPAGLITYPLTFFLSNLVSELYGKTRARSMVWTAFFMNILTFAMIQVALVLPAASEIEEKAFESVMGLGGLRIFASLSAFLIAQIVDIEVYALIRKWTKSRFLWLRNNGATWASQMVDTIVIDLIFLYWGLSMQIAEVASIMLFSFAYKAIFSMASTPILYLFSSKKGDFAYEKKL